MVPICRKMRAWNGALDGLMASCSAAASSMAVSAVSHDRMGTGERNHMRVG